MASSFKSYKECTREFLESNNIDSRKEFLKEMCIINEPVTIDALDSLFLVSNRVFRDNKVVEKQFIWLIFDIFKKKINNQLDSGNGSNNNNNNNSNILEYFFTKFFGDDSIIREFYQLVISLKNTKQSIFTSTLFKEIIIPSIDYLNKQSLNAYFGTAILLINFKTKNKSASASASTSASDLDSSSQQLQQQQIDYTILFESIDIYINKLLEFSKTTQLFEMLSNNGDLDVLVTTSNQLLNIYLLGCKIETPALLNFAGPLKNIIINYLLPANKRESISYQNVLEVILKTTTSYFNGIIDDIKSKKKVSNKNLKLFKFNSTFIQFLISSFSPIFSSNELCNTIKVIMDMASELLPNKSLCDVECYEIIKVEIQPIFEKYIEVFISANINDIQWLTGFIEVINNSSNNSNNSNNNNNSSNNNNNNNSNQNLRILKAIMLIFNNSKILNSEHFSNERQLSSVLIQLFKNSIGLLENCYYEIFQIPYTQSIIMKSFKSLVLYSSITKSNEFFNQLVSLIFYSNSIIQNLLINVWYLVIKNSTEAFQNWNLQFLIQIILKFNDRYEVSEFLDMISILLKRVFGLLSYSQQKVIYKHLVLDVLYSIGGSVGDTQSTEIQDSSKLIPISVGIFFFIIDNGNLVIDYDLKNDIRSTLVPFLITKLNQENIYSFPNLMENLLFILSKINYKLKLEDTNLINNIVISILTSITQSSELCKLFETSFIVPNCLEILGANCDYLSIDQLNRVLLVCSSNSISAQPVSKYPICTLIGRIGQSSICNSNLEKLDHVQYFKSIYQNLFSSASLVLYLNIEESLKSFIMPTSSPFSNNTTLNNNNNNSNNSNNSSTDIDMKELKPSPPPSSQFIKLYLDKIIPKDEIKKINDFLSSKPQAVSTIPLNDTKRYNDEATAIQKYDQFRKSNLRERYNVLDCQQINIQSVFKIEKPTLSTKLSSSNGLSISSTGKLINNNPPKGFSRDELNYGLECIKEGITRIKKQIDFGIKMDKDSLDSYRRNFKQVGEQISELYDNLY